jgi:hypothetical protein
MHRLEVLWRSGARSVINGVHANRLYEIHEPEAKAKPPVALSALTPIFEDVSSRLGHRHEQPPVDDFINDPLLPRRTSQGGPGVAWVDADRDGWEDLAIMGDDGLQLFGNTAGRFKPVSDPKADVPALAAPFKTVERVNGWAKADLDGDGDADWVLATEWGPVRVFRNDEGEYTEQTDALGLAEYRGWWNGVAMIDANNDGWLGESPKHPSLQLAAPIVAAGDDAVAGGRADRRRGVGVSKAHALPGQAIAVRCPRPDTGVGEIAVAKIVGKNENNIRLVRSA